MIKTTPIQPAHGSPSAGFVIGDSILTMLSPEKLEHWPLTRLLEYARNPRKNDHAVDAMAAAIREFGFQVPIIAKSDGTIIDGHLRFKAARKLGLDKVPVLVGDGMSETQIKAFRISVNKVAELAGWDDELLALELQELTEAGYDLALTGFDEEALSELLDSVEEDASDESDDDADDDVPEVEADAVSRPGDVWLLGRHRLICGDAADTAVVAALMQGERARLCFTSPPYGNQREYTTGGIADWDALMRGVFGQLPMSDDGQVLVNLGLIHRDSEVVLYWDTWLEWMRSRDWRRFGWYVWDQGPGLPGDWVGRLAPSFEFVFHFNKVKRKPNKIVPCKSAGSEGHLRADGTSNAMRSKDGKLAGWQHVGRPVQDMRIPDSVIRIMRHKNGIGKGLDHPAVFPVTLPKFGIEAYSDAGDIVYEPFGGSGSTMLAAEATDRACRTVEIGPQYVDVAVKRFQRNHPSVAVTLAATGQSFEEVSAERLREPAKT